MVGNVRPKQNTVTQKEVMMKLLCSLKVYPAMASIIILSFREKYGLKGHVKVIEMSGDVCNLMSKSSPTSSRNPLNQLGPRVLVSKETLLPCRCRGQVKH